MIARTIRQPFTGNDAKLDEYEGSFTVLRDHLVALVNIEGAVTIENVETQLGELHNISLLSFDLPEVGAFWKETAADFERIGTDLRDLSESLTNKFYHPVKVAQSCITSLTLSLWTPPSGLAVFRIPAPNISRPFWSG